MIASQFYSPFSHFLPFLSNVDVMTCVYNTQYAYEKIAFVFDQSTEFKLETMETTATHEVAEERIK